MPRIRSIKPEFAESRSMAKCSRDARLTFILLWTRADDDGRLKGNPRLLANTLYPYDDDAVPLMAKWLSELDAAGCIYRYHDDEDDYIQIIHWKEHQRIEKPSQSKLPPPTPNGNGNLKNGEFQEKTAKFPDHSPIIPVTVSDPSATPPASRARSGTGKGKERKGPGREGECRGETRDQAENGRPPPDVRKSERTPGPESVGSSAIDSIMPSEPASLQVRTGGLATIGEIAKNRLGNWPWPRTPV